MSVARPVTEKDAEKKVVEEIWLVTVNAGPGSCNISKKAIFRDPVFQCVVKKIPKESGDRDCVSAVEQGNLMVAIFRDGHIKTLLIEKEGKEVKKMIWEILWVLSTIVILNIDWVVYHLGTLQFQFAKWDNFERFLSGFESESTFKREAEGCTPRTVPTPYQDNDLVYRAPKTQ